MVIVLWLLFGGFIGWFASLLTEDADRMGIIANIIVGLIGALIGALLTDLFGWGRINAFTFPGVLLSLLGAVLLLWVLNRFNKSR